MQWEHHPSHFWLVLLTAAINVALAYVTNVAAGRYRDARLVLVSLAFLASAGFLGLHALATPDVLLPLPNVGFVVATPVGLIIASVFAAARASAARRSSRGDGAPRWRSALLVGLLALMAVWAVLSLAGLPPLDGPPPSKEVAGLLAILRSWPSALYVVRGVALRPVLPPAAAAIVLLTMAVALVLLAEAMIAVPLSRNWHAAGGSGTC